ncbi:MAG: hypothetical protein K6T78_12690 [Alicyclobacillus sp.]|nr:hypothetical protein [Alicyclobacillus sp.]
MRIDDVQRNPYQSVRNANRTPAPVGKSSPETEPAARDTAQRAERIEALKRMFSAGQPIDVNQLATKLVESGILFDDKA